MSFYRACGSVCVLMVLGAAAFAAASAQETTPSPETESAPAVDNTLTQVESATSEITDGSFEWAENQLVVTGRFSGDLLLFDPAAGGAAKVSSGMTKQQVLVAMAEGGLTFDDPTADEWQVGSDTLIFEDDKLVAFRH